MGKVKDMTGMRFGKLQVIKRAETENKRLAFWECLCDCGGKKIASGRLLRNGHVTTCGCRRIPFKDREVKNIVMNEYIDHGVYMSGKMLNGDEFFIDNDDYDKIKKYRWGVHKSGYVTANTEFGSVKMHRLIIGAKKGEIVDHINHNKLDNRKENLRICTSQQNAMNREDKHKSKSGIMGVSYYKRTEKWMARISMDGRSRTKFFKNIEDAISQRKAWEKEMFGEYANRTK